MSVQVLSIRLQKQFSDYLLTKFYILELDIVFYFGSHALMSASIRQRHK